MYASDKTLSSLGEGREIGGEGMRIHVVVIAIEVNCFIIRLAPRAVVEVIELKVETDLIAAVAGLALTFRKLFIE
jgi:hypothetical protein